MSFGWVAAKVFDQLKMVFAVSLTRARTLPSTVFEECSGGHMILHSAVNACASRSVYGRSVMGGLPLWPGIYFRQSIWMGRWSGSGRA